MTDKTSLPKLTLDALPYAKNVAELIDELSDAVDRLFKEADKRKRTDAITMARVFVVLHRLNDKFEVLHRSSSTLGKFGKLYETYKKEVIPQMLEAANVSHIALAEGFRVTVNDQVFVSVKDRDKAFHWLRANQLGDLITSTVNSSTLSAALRKKIEDDNLEPPVDVFSIANISNTSVTATK